MAVSSNCSCLIHETNGLIPEFIQPLYFKGRLMQGRKKLACHGTAVGLNDTP